jgi:methylated-DNA-[protein]-cysteine S-methyltransferase
MEASFSTVAAPWGPIHVAATSRGVVGLELLTPTAAFVSAIERRVQGAVEPADGADPRTAAILGRVSDRIAAFLSGERPAFDDLPVDLRPGSPWDRRVLDGVRQIPFGAVTSYGRLARLIGSPGAARAVGGAVGRNPIGLIIPCHRVIAGDGSIGGYGGYWWGSREQMLGIKRDLLALEGVRLPAAALIG